MKTQMTKPAKDCQTMAEVRLGVDALDLKLVALICQRQGFMEAAARIKNDRDAVHDSVRIEDVISKVKAAAIEAGLSVDIAEPVWRELIKQSIAYEFKQWDRMRTPE
ncbi:MAG: chorismate mutase [Robiginitomaculum sp.]|nr:chorismate mutase [Robiginitomaculum sp.]